MTLDFAVEWIEWKKEVKRRFPDRFYWHDQGMWVRTPDGDIGLITEYTYFPKTDTFYISVTIMSRIVTFNDPNLLEVVPEPKKLTWCNSAA